MQKLRQAFKDKRIIMAGQLIEFCCCQPLLLFHLKKVGLSASATQKIVDISHKNHDLHAELALEKNKTQRAQEQISELKELIKSHEVSNNI